MYCRVWRNCWAVRGACGNDPLLGKLLPKRTMSLSEVKTPDSDEGCVKTLAPGEYIKANGWHHRMATLVLDLLQMSFDIETDGRAKFLDVGCGPGNITRDLLLPKCGPGSKIVATDLSREVLHYAEKHFAHPMIEYELLDIGRDVSEFAKKHGKFSRVYSFFCINWLKYQRPAMRNIAELMAPGGECLLVFDARNPLTEFRKKLTEHGPWKQYSKLIEDGIPPSQYLATRHDLLGYVHDLLREAGLTPQMCEVLQNIPKLKSVDAVIQADLGSSPITCHLTKEELPKYVEDVTRIYHENWTPNEVADPAYRVAVYVVHATKLLK